MMTDAERRAQSNRGVALFFGWLLIVMGALIGSLSGLCIAAFASGGGGMAGVAWAIGGLPLFAGFGLFIGGVAILVTLPKPQARPRDLAAFSDREPPQGPPA